MKVYLNRDQKFDDAQELNALICHSTKLSPNFITTWYSAYMQYYRDRTPIELVEDK